jgi:hypothetical protein
MICGVRTSDLYDDLPMLKVMREPYCTNLVFASCINAAFFASKFKTYNRTVLNVDEGSDRSLGLYILNMPEWRMPPIRNSINESNWSEI